MLDAEDEKEEESAVAQVSGPPGVAGSSGKKEKPVKDSEAVKEPELDDGDVVSESGGGAGALGGDVSPPRPGPRPGPVRWCGAS